MALLVAFKGRPLQDIGGHIRKVLNTVQTARRFDPVLILLSYGGLLNYGILHAVATFEVSSP